MSNIASQGHCAPAPSRAQNLYFAVWRWHFYAGLYVIPFLIMMAVTGIMMIWFTAIAPEYGDRIGVPPQAAPLSISAQEAAANLAYPTGKIGQYIAPYDAQTPALFRVDLENSARMLALDPYRGTILRDTELGATWNDVITNIHGELLIGNSGGIGDLLIEVAASLTLLMVATGLYLVWPRNHRGFGRGLRTMLVPDLAAKGRAWWKSLHAVLGFWISILLVFFLISGLAWAGIWGGKFVQAWSTFPAEKWDNVPLSDETHASMNHTAIKTVPWALEQTLMPQSGSAAGITGLPMGTPVVLETVVALGRAIGFDGRFQVAVPADKAADKAAVWTLSQDTISHDSANPMGDLTVHIDRYTGKILANIGFADYSLAGKSMAVGIALHEGQTGLWNVILNMVFCLVVVFVAVSGAVMWWMRRPVGAGRLAAPPLPETVPLAKGAVLIGLFLSMAFPVLGLTLIAVLLLDWVVLGSIPALKRALS